MFTAFTVDTIKSRVAGACVRIGLKISGAYTIQAWIRCLANIYSLVTT